MLYTRRGDQGDTSLYGSRRVPKNSPRVEAYGTIDELNSWLGVVVAGSIDKRITAPLREIQGLLFVAGADLATDLETTIRVPRIGLKHTKLLESKTDELLRVLPRLTRFILPGGSKTAAELQYARTVCRRAERRLVAASQEEKVNKQLLPFFNRLSSYLFNLARYSNLLSKNPEETWVRDV